MVSFFGLRFGGDKKKQPKQPDKKQTAQQPQQGDQTSPGEDQPADHDLSQQPSRLSRPGTQDPAQGRNIDLRRTVSDIPAASSMMDLSSPSPSRRQPSVGSLGQLVAGEDASMPKRSTTSLMLPSPFGNGGARPSSSTRPSSSQLLKRLDPLDVHFPKSSPAEGAAAHDVIANSPLDRIKFDVRDLRERGGISVETDRDMLERDGGYPSPPASLEEGREARPTVSTTSSGRKGPAPLPSPVPSASLFEEKEEMPVIRNVQAKRDTLTFVSPRRRSFTMEIQGAGKEKHNAGTRLEESPDAAADASEHQVQPDMGLMESPTEMASEAQKHLHAASEAVMPHPDAELFEREAPKGFNSRKGSDNRARGARPSPQPLTLSTSSNLLSANSWALDKPMPSPLASKTPMEGKFPVSKGLPRGRLPPRPSMSSEPSTVESDDSSSMYSMPALELDPSEPRRSAMPAPLFPGSSQDPLRAPTMAPLASPTFSNVDQELSRDTFELARAFEISLDIPHTSPIDCDFGDFLKE